VESPNGPALLLRPVTEFAVRPVSTSRRGCSIELRAVQRLPYKDSERVKSVEGVELLRTQLVLEIEQVHSGDHTGSPMVADIELVADAEDPEIKRLHW